MTVPAGTFQTFQSVGNREDLEDVIYDISPTETPFVRLAKKGKAKATFHEWQTDALDSAAANAKIQGDDAAVNTAVATTRLRNYCQILSKTVSISGTQDAVDKAGRDSELSYQMAKRMREVKRDLEFMCIRNQQSTAGTAAVAATSAGVESWLATNKTTLGVGTTTATTPGYASGTVAAPTDATTPGTLTETPLRSIIAAAFTQGGDPTILMVGPLTKQKISFAFSGVATRNRDYGSDKQVAVISGVDLYVSDFGEHKIVPNRFMRDQNILALDMEYWELAFLRNWKTWELAKTGDSEKRQILAEVTLVSRQEKASAKVTDINPAL